MNTTLIDSPLNAIRLPAPVKRKVALVEFLPPPLFAITLALLVMHSWRRTLDPVIDFGRELYTPWQLASGKTLYTDIAAFYGPLSQYANALAFKLFGPSLSTLIALNLATLAIATAMLYLLLRQVATLLAATVGTLLFIVMFATAHVGAVGNFNFITPYSHEATHGITLSIAALLAFARYSRTHRIGWLAVSAACAGCVVMTKPEITLALGGALLIGFAFHVRSTGFKLKRGQQANASTPHTVLVAAGGFMLPLALMTAFLATRSPLPDALQHTFGAYLLMSNGELLQSRFYANSMGLENPGGQVAVILLTAARMAAILVPPLLAAFFVRNRILGAVVGVLLALTTGALLGLHWWAQAGEILLLGTLVLAVLVGISAFTRPRHVQARKVPQIALATFSVLILAKMLLHTRFHQYGFILAIMPTMLLAVALIDQVPTWLVRRGANPWTFRAPALAVLAMLAYVSLWISNQNLKEQRHAVGSAGNHFFTDERAGILNDAAAWLGQNTRSDQTLTVLPEGLLLNVLAQRQTSIPYLSTLPSDIAMFSEPRILEALRENPPQFIAIIQRETSDFGQRNFGADYALDLRNHITQNYHPVHLAGAIPYTSENFGILILERNR